MLYRVDNRPATTPAKPAPKGVGEAVGEAAKQVLDLGDDLQLSKKKAVTPEQVDQAFDRLEKAERTMRHLSVGTLGPS